ncbi:PilN domain-containing protein [Thermodesulfobacteriota bacterium]
MIKINLLPFRAARKRENVKRQITVFALSVALIVVVIIFYFFSLNGKLNTLMDEEVSLKNELASYQKELNEIKDLERKITEVNSKLEVITKLKQGKTGPVLLLADIADAVPKDRLWLTSLTEEKGKLSLRGTAMDNETVALFMKNLERTEQIIGPPELKSSRRRKINQFQLTVSDFDLQCVTYAAGK